MLRGVPAQKFTGKERDAETGLDYFGARYFSGAQGRFTSADDPFNDQDTSDPQSWNLYGYVRNNPLTSIDPTGMFEEKPPDPWAPGGALFDHAREIHSTPGFCVTTPPAPARRPVAAASDAFLGSLKLPSSPFPRSTMGPA